MATNYTSLLGFALPTTGELDGTWGTVVNDSITQLVEDSVAGVATQSVASGNWTLTTTGSGAANQARCAIIIPTGSPGVSRNVIAPSQSKAYIVINQSNAAIVFKGAATTGVTIGAGDKALVAWNGSDFVRIGASAGGSNTQVQYNDNGNLAGSANLTFNGTTLTAAGFSGPLNGTVGATTPSTSVFTQVDITAQGDLRLQDSAGGEYVALQAPTTLSSSYTLTMPTTDGDANQVLTTDGSGVLSWGSPASLNTPLAVIGNATAGAEIRLPEDTDNGTNYIALKAPDALASNVTLTLPNSDGDPNQVLTTDGSGGLSWTTPSTGGGGAAGNLYLAANFGGF
jgi:hypothetical protein